MRATFARMDMGGVTRLGMMPHRTEGDTMAVYTPMPLTHDHPPLAEGQRECEPGILATCRACRAPVGHCTGSPIDVRAVVGRTWICTPCREGNDG